MNNQCLITKLKGSVTDNTIPVFGQIKMKVGPYSSPTNTNNWITYTNKGGTLKIEGDAVFKETGTKTLNIPPNVSVNITITGFTENDSYLFINDKYNLSELVSCQCYDINFDVVKMCQNFTRFQIFNDVDYYKKLPFYDLDLFFKNNPNLNSMTCNTYKMVGDASEFKLASVENHNLVMFTIRISEDSYGDYTGLAMTYRYSSNIIPDQVYTSNFMYRNGTADISLFYGGYISATNSTARWEYERPLDYPMLMTASHIDFGDYVEAYLINNAKLTFYEPPQEYMKKIIIHGNWDNPSQEALNAIQTLYSKGVIEVNINNTIIPNNN